MKKHTTTIHEVFFHEDVSTRECVIATALFALAALVLAGTIWFTLSDRRVAVKQLRPKTHSIEFVELSEK